MTKFKYLLIIWALSQEILMQENTTHNGVLVKRVQHIHEIKARMIIHIDNQENIEHIQDQLRILGTSMETFKEVINLHDETKTEPAITHKIHHFETKRNDLIRKLTDNERRQNRDRENNSRNKRALIGIIGETSKFLFGTATENQVNAIKQDTLHLEVKVAKLNFEMQDLKTLVDKTIEITSALNRQMMDMVHNINQIKSFITAWTTLETLLDTLEEIEMAIADNSKMMTEINIGNLETALTHQLKTQIIEEANRIFNQFEVPCKQTELKQCINIIRSDRNHIILNLYLAKPNNITEYKLEKFPTVNNAGETVMLESLTKQIKIDADTNRTVKFASCRIIQNNDKFCFDRIPIPTLTKTEECTQDLITGNRNNFRQNCKYKTMNLNYTYVNSANNIYYVFFPHETTYKLTCGRHTTPLSNVKGLLILSPPCKLETPQLYLTTILTNNNTHIQVNTSLPKIVPFEQLINKLIKNQNETTTSETDIGSEINQTKELSTIWSWNHKTEIPTNSGIIIGTGTLLVLILASVLITIAVLKLKSKIKTDKENPPGTVNLTINEKREDSSGSSDI